MPRERHIIRDYLCQRGRIVNRLSRIRHFRGHGVHSPYIYGMVRKIFTEHKDSNVQYDSDLANILTENGLSKKRSCELARIADYCNFTRFEVDSLEPCDMVILSQKIDPQRKEEITRVASERGTAIVVVKPYLHIELSNRLLKRHISTSIDRYDYLILLNNHLPKQHFRL